ncbi:MAG: DUF6883 domain-containing protein [Solirubrobacteraceae bacterium]
MRPEGLWPPRTGEPLPRAAKAVGVHRKLAGYSLDLTHEEGGPKARGFALILGITLDDINYLAAEITAGVLQTPISTVEENPPYGISCVVNLPIRGLGPKTDRIVNVRTAWLIADADTPPRLVSAYIKP